MKVQVSHRLDEGLLAWATEYAESLSTPERRITRSAVIEGGLKHLRELAGGGVPDLEPEEPVRVASVTRQARVNALRGRR